MEQLSSFVFYKSTIDNGPQFDGRFFVKIYNDDVFRRNIVSKIDTEKLIEYKAIPDGSRKIYGLQTEENTDRILKHFDSTSLEPIVFKDKWTDEMKKELLSNVLAGK